MNKYRYELKYLCTVQQAALIRGRLKGLASLDRHVNRFGVYQVRSLYFDDMYDTAYFSNEDGTEPREKYRIRYYNNTDRLQLELKKKLHGKTLKLTAPLSKPQCEKLIRGEYAFDETNPDILNKLMINMKTHLMHPVVIVEFERTPFVYPIGNVRITIDAHIMSSNAFDCFFDDHISRRPVLPDGLNILEVKFDELLPDTIKQCIELDNLQYTAFSKYYNSRYFHL